MKISALTVIISVISSASSSSSLTTTDHDNYFPKFSDLKIYFRQNDK